MAALPTAIRRPWISLPVVLVSAPVPASAALIVPACTSKVPDDDSVPSRTVPPGCRFKPPSRKETLSDPDFYLEGETRERCSTARMWRAAACPIASLHGSLIAA